VCETKWAKGLKAGILAHFLWDFSGQYLFGVPLKSLPLPSFILANYILTLQIIPK
jgi:hypothetical protein